MRQGITVLFALIGIGVMAYYTFCDTECTYLRGDVLGFDLRYIGVVYMALIALLAILGRYPFLRILLAAGIGGEVFLLSFQVSEGIYCPYCLAFMGCVVGSFVLHYEYPPATGWKRIAYLFGEVRLPATARRYPLLLFMLAGYGFLALTFSGSARPAYAAEPLPRAFGQGTIEVRIYTDYFCSPCRDMEPRVETLIEEIADKGKGRILFVDTPMHPPQTLLYARYFLYALEADGKDIRTVNRIRKALFEAAARKILTEGGLENFLRAKKIVFHPHNVLPVFKKYNEYIRTDNIRSTPTIVVISPGGRVSYVGASDIVTELEKIRAGTGE